MAVGGRAALVALLLSLVVLAAPAPGWTLLAVDGALVLLVAVDVWLAASPRQLRWERRLPPAGRLGEPLGAALLVTNPTRRVLRARVRDAWPPSAGLRPSVVRVVVPAGQTRRLEQTLSPTRRGERRAVIIAVRSFGPLRLGARQRKLTVPGSVRVLPPFRSRRLLPEKLARLRFLEGQVAVRGPGRGSEFDSLREYVPGDDPRAIDWRASARKGVGQRLQVRVYRPEQDRRIVLVLDTGRTSAARVGDETRLDVGMDAALLLAALARFAGDRVDLVAGDVAVRAVVERADLSGLSTVMAGLEPVLAEADVTRLVGQVNRLARRRCLVVLFTDLSPAVVEEGLLPALGPLVRRHQLMVAAVADPRTAAMADVPAGDASVDDAYAAAAADRTLGERARLAELLRARGAEVVDVPPASFASAVSDCYLALKAAGRL